MKLIPNKKGYSLLEIVIAVGLFVFIMLASTNIFQFIVQGQNKTLNSQAIQESLGFAFEIISKEVRNAKKDQTSTCADLPDDVLYKINLDGSVLYFKNKNNECVSYSLENDRFKISRDAVEGYITPANIEVTNLEFYVSESVDSQAYVTVVLVAKSQVTQKESQTMRVQTSISSRFY